MLLAFSLGGGLSMRSGLPVAMYAAISRGRCQRQGAAPPGAGTCPCTCVSLPSASRLIDCRSVAWVLRVAGLVF